MKNTIDKKVVIFGASGMLGYGVYPVLKSHYREVIPSGRTNRYHQKNFISLDVSHFQDVINFLQKEKPDLVLYATGIIDKTYCEQHRKYTEAVHLSTPARIAQILSDWGASLTYISSESVYGNEGGDYAEESPLNPNSYYAESKAAGEQACLEENPNSLILRVTPVGLTPNLARGTLAEWAYQALTTGKNISGYQHHLFTPISSSQLGECLSEAWEKKLRGTFNLGCKDSLSKYKFLKGIEKRINKPLVGKISAAKFTEPPSIYKATLDSSKWAKSTYGKLPTATNVLDSLFCHD